MHAFSGCLRKFLTGAYLPTLPYVLVHVGLDLFVCTTSCILLVLIIHSVAESFKCESCAIFQEPYAFLFTRNSLRLETHLTSRVHTRPPSIVR